MDIYIFGTDRQTDQPTDQPTDRPTDIATYRAAIAAKNVRNHLFIVYGIVANIVNEGQSCVDVRIYDLVQAFDSLWLQDCMDDIFDILPEKKRDRKLALIYETNLNKIGLLLCHSHIELRLWLRLS